VRTGLRTTVSAGIAELVSSAGSVFFASLIQQGRAPAQSPLLDVAAL
jgi:hypothetical protein